MEKRGQLRLAIPQQPFVGNRAWKFTGEPERTRRSFDPAADRGVGRRVVKGGVDFHRREIPRIKFQPARGRQIRRVKISAPFLEAPGAGPEADFLLGREVQTVRRIIGSGREGSLRDSRNNRWYSGLSNLTERVS